MIEKIMLVNKNDRMMGYAEKMKVHKEGKLHRAFSIFVFNKEGQLLIQKRAKTKYHSGGLWSNTCCGHQRFGESLEKSAHRRLKEEMRFDCGLEEKFTFTYKIKFDNGLTENEYDHVFVGSFDGEPRPNPKEVSEWKWIHIRDLNPEYCKIAEERLRKVPERLILTIIRKRGMNDKYVIHNKIQTSQG